MKDILPELDKKDYISNISIQYDVHFCNNNEVEELVSFIDKHWRKNHIFVKSRELLNWQHYDSKHGRYNFVIAKHKASGEIHSILGFVPTYQFDSNINNVEVWMCIWKTREDIHVKGLGSSLIFFLKSNMKIETISQIGISETNSSISKKMGFYTGVADHYYLANKSISEELSTNLVYNDNTMVSEKQWIIRPIELNEFKALDSKTKVISQIDRYKSKNYYINRYYKHPFYKYKCYAICNEDEIQTILTSRECENNGRKCLRIIDIIGNIEGLRYAHDSIIQLMFSNCYEYIDLISAGLPDNVLRSTGFENRRDNNETIIPNYFEPFLKKNIDMRYAYKTINPEVNIVIYKGDSDQDRPNIV